MSSDQRNLLNRIRRRCYPSLKECALQQNSYFLHLQYHSKILPLRMIPVSNIFIRLLNGPFSSPSGIEQQVFRIFELQPFDGSFGQCFTYRLPEGRYVDVT